MKKMLSLFIFALTHQLWAQVISGNTTASALTPAYPTYKFEVPTKNNKPEQWIADFVIQPVAPFNIPMPTIRITHTNPDGKTEAFQIQLGTPRIVSVYAVRLAGSEKPYFVVHTLTANSQEAVVIDPLTKKTVHTFELFGEQLELGIDKDDRLRVKQTGNTDFEKDYFPN